MECNRQDMRHKAGILSIVLVLALAISGEVSDAAVIAAAACDVARHRDCTAIVALPAPGPSLPRAARARRGKDYRTRHGTAA